MTSVLVVVVIVVVVVAVMVVIANNMLHKLNIYISRFHLYIYTHEYICVYVYLLYALCINTYDIVPHDSLYGCGYILSTNLFIIAMSYLIVYLFMCIFASYIYSIGT